MEKLDVFLFFKRALSYFLRVDHWAIHKLGEEIPLPLAHIPPIYSSLILVLTEMKSLQLAEVEEGLVFSCTPWRHLS